MVPTRRALLRTAGCAAAVGLAGCLTDDPPAGTPRDASPDGPAATGPARRTRRQVGDGTGQWRASLEAGGVSLAVGERAAVAVDDGGTVLAVDRSHGSELWRATVAGTPRGLAADDDAYVATEDRLHVLADGTARWRASPGAAVTAPPTRIGDRVLVGSTYPGTRPGDATPTPPPTDSAIDGGFVAYTTDGDADWTAAVDGEPAWVVGTDGWPLIGYRGLRVETLTVEPQVTMVTSRGGSGGSGARPRSSTHRP